MPHARQEMVIRALHPQRRRELLEQAIEQVRALRTVHPVRALARARDVARLASAAREDQLWVRAQLEQGNLYRILDHPGRAFSTLAAAERAMAGDSAAARNDLAFFRASLLLSISQWRRAVQELLDLGHAGASEPRRRVLLALGYGYLGDFAEADRSTGHAMREAERRDDLLNVFAAIHNTIERRLAAGCWADAEKLFAGSQALYSLVPDGRAELMRGQIAAILAVPGDEPESSALRFRRLRDLHRHRGEASHALHSTVWEIAVVCDKGTSRSVWEVSRRAAAAVEQEAKVRGVSFDPIIQRPLPRRDLWRELQHIMDRIGGSSRKLLYRRAA